jgi:hypothetical protein
VEEGKSAGRGRLCCFVQSQIKGGENGVCVHVGTTHIVAAARTWTVFDVIILCSVSLLRRIRLDLEYHIFRPIMYPVDVMYPLI